MPELDIEIEKIKDLVEKKKKLLANLPKSLEYLRLHIDEEIHKLNTQIHKLEKINTNGHWVMLKKEINLNDGIAHDIPPLPFAVSNRLDVEQNTLMGQQRKTKYGYGDAECEDLRISRGKYNAWMHVILAFIIQVIVTLAVFITLLDHLFGIEKSNVFIVFISGIIAVGLSVIIYWDRWECIEAFASNFCTGIANFSILVAPPAAFLYANYRGIMKLFRR